MQLNKLAKSIILSTTLLSIFSTAYAEEIRVAIGTRTPPLTVPQVAC